VAPLADRGFPAASALVFPDGSRGGCADTALMNQPIITATALTKVYGEGATEVRALDGVDFVVQPGEFVAIMGPSGSGKSTLLHVVGALEPATAGTVALEGERYDGLPDDELTRLRRERMGFVFQFFNLLPSLSALENVLLPALIARHANDETHRRAVDLLERVGLSGRADHTPGELSGGEQQRVSIARALLLSPQVVLADEPTGNLDSRAGGQILRLMRELNRDEGVTVVMVTHDPSAAAIADRIVFLRDGRICEEIAGGSTERVIEAFGRVQSPAPEPELADVGGTAAGIGV
jgi:putative ABC transport system ATP-binding protein